MVLLLYPLVVLSSLWEYESLDPRAYIYVDEKSSQLRVRVSGVAPTSFLSSQIYVFCQLEHRTIHWI